MISKLKGKKFAKLDKNFVRYENKLQVKVDNTMRRTHET